MRSNSCTFSVNGRPAPQGSKKYVGNGRYVESSKYLVPWRKAVREAAVANFVGDPWATPVRVRIVFRMAKPQKPKFADFPATKPDIDKLVRSCLDAVTGVCFVDDSLVVSVEADKVFADEPGADFWFVTV